MPLSLALHGALIAALILLVHHAMLPRPHVEPGIAVVFKSTGLTKSAKQNAAPKAARKGPPSEAKLPPPPAPPPPPPPPPRVAARRPQPVPKPAPLPVPPPPAPKQPMPTPPKVQPKVPAKLLPKPPPVPTLPKVLPKPPPQVAKAQPKPSPEEQPQVRLNLPSVAQLMPPAQPQPEHKAAPRPKQVQPPPSQRFIVMNNRSYGSAGAPSRPNPNFRHGMKLSLSQSDLMHQAPSITFKGKAGADWESAFSKWVNEHKYYPDGAAENDEQGSVTISMTVLPDGSVHDLHLVKGSGSPILNMAWLGLFQGVHVPKFPPGSKAKREHVTATMHFILIH